MKYTALREDSCAELRTNPWKSRAYQDDYYLKARNHADQQREERIWFFLQALSLNHKKVTISGIDLPHLLERLDDIPDKWEFKVAFTSPHTLVVFMQNSEGNIIEENIYHSGIYSVQDVQNIVGYGRSTEYNPHDPIELNSSEVIQQLKKKVTETL